MGGANAVAGCDVERAVLADEGKLHRCPRQADSSERSRPGGGPSRSLRSAPVYVATDRSPPLSATNKAVFAMTRHLQALARRGGLSVRRESVRSSAALRRAHLLRHTQATLLFDVGAYVGQYVRDIRSGGFRGRVVSCEPQSETFRELRATASSDPLWEVRNVALGARSGSVELHISDTAYCSSVLPMTDRLREISPNEGSVSTETAEVTTLDELVAEYASHADRIALKIDVQGYESEVLDGGGSALKRTCFIECEINLDPLYEGQSDASQLFARLFGEGLRLASTDLAYVDPETGAAAWLDAIFIREQ